VTHAAEPGTLGFRGYGRAVAIDTGAGHVLLAHLDTIAVRPGERVAAGERIGTSGRTGIKRTAPELHFEVAPRPYPMHSEAARIDPIAWITDGGRVHPIAGRPANASQFPTRKRPAAAAIVVAVLLSAATAIVLSKG
jgi:murein DD-endopeptidase MepM/ murein hydrolase activator NlpD